MNAYQENLAEHRRLTILRLLAEGGGVSNESVLFDGLESVGLDAGLTRIEVRDALKWLQERDLVKNVMVSETLMRVHITERGIDASKGRVLVKGVKKPSIGVL